MGVNMPWISKFSSSSRKKAALESASDRRSSKAASTGTKATDEEAVERFSGRQVRGNQKDQEGGIGKREEGIVLTQIVLPICQRCEGEIMKDIMRNDPDHWCCQIVLKWLDQL